MMKKKEQYANWWYYHKWQVIIGVILLGCLANILKSALHIGEVQPDYRVAYVGTTGIPDDTAALLQTMFEEAGEDLNQDGKVIVEICQYISHQGSDSESTYYRYASEVTLLADLDDCDSFFFLLEDPEAFQREYGVLAYVDGSLPSDTAEDYNNMYISWGESPLLSKWEFGDYHTDTLGMELSGSSDELLQKLFLARRGFWTEKVCANREGCEEMWNKICGERTKR